MKVLWFQKLLFSDFCRQDVVRSNEFRRSYFSLQCNLEVTKIIINQKLDLKLLLCHFLYLSLSLSFSFWYLFPQSLRKGERVDYNVIVFSWWKIVNFKAGKWRSCGLIDISVAASEFIIIIVINCINTLSDRVTCIFYCCCSFRLICEEKTRNTLWSWLPVSLLVLCFCFPRLYCWRCSSRRLKHQTDAFLQRDGGAYLSFPALSLFLGA